jgi:hypothetical protein
VPKHVGVSIIVMNCILLSAFIGRCDCKNMHDTNIIKFANGFKSGDLECRNPRVMYCFFEKHRRVDLVHIHCNLNLCRRNFMKCICYRNTNICYVGHL